MTPTSHDILADINALSEKALNEDVPQHVLDDLQTAGDAMERVHAFLCHRSECQSPETGDADA